MTPPTSAKTRANSQAFALTALIVFQTVCAAFFIGDVVSDAMTEGPMAWLDWHLGIEFLAAGGLFAGVAVEAVMLRRILARAARTERAIGIAQGALQDLVDGYFRDWTLTPAEADVAAFTLRGYSIAEIAGFRGSAEGTVKTHLNAIYRKAGVAGRGQLVSLLIEDLMHNPLLPAPASAGVAEPVAAMGGVEAGPRG